MLALLLAAGVLVPENADIGHAGDRIKNPLRDPAASEEVKRGYRIFLDTPRHARRFNQSNLSCGSCHLNAGQKEGSLPLVGIAAIFPDYNKRSGRPFTLEERVVG